MTISKDEQYISNISQYLVDSYRETENFSIFLEQHSKHCYWMIFSDYCFAPLNSPKNSVITATIIPFSDYKWIQIYCSLSKLKTKLDIKNSYINEKHISFVKFIESLPAFHISLKIDKNLDYYKNETIDEKQFFIQYFEGIKTHYSNHINYGIAQPNAKMNMNNIKKVITELKKRPKIEKFKQAQIVSSLISSISKMIIDIAQGENKILWCSDRDDILSYLKKSISQPFVFDMIRNDIYKLKPKNRYCIDFLKKNNTDFDELIRIPDYIAGTISDLNLEKVAISHEKFLPILYSFLTNSNKSLVLSLKNNSNNIELTKYDFKKVVTKEPDWNSYK